MTRGILIAGNDSSLFSAAGAEALKRVESFSSAIIPNRFTVSEGGALPPPKTETPAGFIPLTWNPSSPISARTLVLAAENRLKQINDAILICLPPAVFKNAESLTPEEIEILINDQIKGWFFLIRELALYFSRTGSGSLSFVTPEPSVNSGGKNTQTDILGPSATASFHSFTQGILSTSANEPYRVMGFTGCEAGAEAEFAAWLFKIIDEDTRKNSGRWHKYSKLGFFR